MSYEGAKWPRELRQAVIGYVPGLGASERYDEIRVERGWSGAGVVGPLAWSSARNICMGWFYNFPRNGENVRRSHVFERSISREKMNVDDVVLR